MHAWFPTGEPVRGVGPAYQTSLTLAFLSGSWATFPMRGTVPYPLSWPQVPGSSLLWAGDMLGNVLSRKCVVLWTVGKASSSMNKVPVTLWTWNDDSGVGDILPGKGGIVSREACGLRIPIPGPGPTLKLASCVWWKPSPPSLCFSIHKGVSG